MNEENSKLVWKVIQKQGDYLKDKLGHELLVKIKTVFEYSLIGFILYYLLY